MPLPDWARACGAPLFSAAIRTSPADFHVSETLGWDFSGDGEHDYLWLQKTSANTEWVARQLARHADVPARDVGYSGLKDRHAVTTQWFSVPRWHAPDWSALDVDGVEVLDVRRHNRKLRRGAHQSNTFRIVLRGAGIEQQADALEQRLTLIREQGVPNYFGEQRFGRDGGNVALADAWASGKRLPRHKRSLAISTMRSLLFNEQLDARVPGGNSPVLHGVVPELAAFRWERGLGLGQQAAHRLEGGFRRRFRRERDGPDLLELRRALGQKEVVHVQRATPVPAARRLIRDGHRVARTVRIKRAVAAIQ